MIEMKIVEGGNLMTEMKIIEGGNLMTEMKIIEGGNLMTEMKIVEGGNLMKDVFAIPTIYNNIKFRSRLEANFAAFLDKQKIKWQYEPSSFLLPSGHYMPDFYLPDIRFWVECKGNDRIENFIKSPTLKEFLNLLEQRSKRETIESPLEEWENFMVISENNVFCYDQLFCGCGWLLANEYDIYLAKCNECNTYNFLTTEGAYECRKCKFTNGDLGHWNGTVEEFPSLWFTHIVKMSKKTKS